MALVLLIAAACPQLQALRDVMRDWAALGLLRSFVWVDESDVDTDRPFPNVIATVVTDRAAPRVRLQDHLADQHDLGLVRLTALSTLGGASAVLPQRVASHLYTGLAGVGVARISPVHCLLARHGAGGWAPGATWTGWHSAVLAPEDAWTPAATATDLTHAHADAEYQNHLAAGVASLVGGWSGAAEAPFDGLPAAGSGQPVVARAFLRHLDASAVTAELRRALTDVSAGLPRPHSGASVCPHLTAPAAGAAQIAQAVLHQHGALFARRREEPVVAHRVQVGALAALRMFFRFLIAAVRRAPGALFEHARTRTAAAVSRNIQQVIFGDSDSRYEVVTLGVTATGLPAGAGDLAQGAEDMAQRVLPLLPTAEPNLPDSSPFWRDVVAGALTLADGGERVAHIPPVLVNGLPAVVPHPALVAPRPDGGFELPAQIAARVGVDRVPPYDVRLHDQVATQLHAADADVGTARTADTFDSWRGEAMAAYTNQVGRALADELSARHGAVAELLHELREARVESEDLRLVEEDQRQTRRTLLIILAGVVLIVALVAGVHGYRLVDLEITYGVAVAAMLAWLSYETVVLYRQQRRIYQLLTARDAVDDRLARATGNLGFAITELHAAAVLYQQYLAWAPVLGRFLHEPFGPVAGPIPKPRLAGSLPRSMGLGIACADIERIAVVTHDLGAAVFRCGWLDRLWISLLEDGPRRLGPAGLALRRNPRQLLSDHAVSADSPLRTWSRLVVADGVSAAAGEELWQQARATLLEGGGQHLCESLFGDVEVVGQREHGVSGRLPAATFLTQLTSAVDDPRARYFSLALFGPTATTENGHAVADTAVTGGAATRAGVRTLQAAPDDGSGLDQFIVVVQLTGPLSADQLRLLSPAESAPTDAPRPADPAFEALDF